MKDKTEWEEDFDNLYLYTDTDFTEPEIENDKIVKAFIRKTIDSAITQEQERIAKEIEDYFEGLIVIPFTQLTKEKILRDIINKE